MRIARGLVFLSLLAGCAASRQNFSYYHPNAKTPFIASLLEKVSVVEKEDFENLRMETLATNPLSSHHLVVIRREEPLHYHAAHDGWALVLKGEADFLLGESGMKLSPGSSVYLPRGIKHKAVRTGGEPVAALVIFTPAYDGKDVVPVEEKQPPA